VTDFADDGVAVRWCLREEAALVAVMCEVGRAILADLDQVVPFRGDRTVSARWVFAHVIEETARHGTTGD
jgi:hypothetical protein